VTPTTVANSAHVVEVIDRDPDNGPASGTDGGGQLVGEHRLA